MGWSDREGKGGGHTGEAHSSYPHKELKRQVSVHSTSPQSPGTPRNNPRNTSPQSPRGGNTQVPINRRGEPGGVLLSREKDGTTRCVWTNPAGVPLREKQTKGHALCDSISMECPRQAHPRRNSQCWGGLPTGCAVSFGEEHVLGSDTGGGCPTLCVSGMSGKVWERREGQRSGGRSLGGLPPSVSASGFLLSPALRKPVKVTRPPLWPLWPWSLGPSLLK